MNKPKIDYPLTSRIMSDDELPAAKQLGEILLATCAVTYLTPKMLARRARLLTPREKKQCDKLWKIASQSLEEIDLIISDRALMENDPWK